MKTDLLIYIIAICIGILLILRFFVPHKNRKICYVIFISLLTVVLLFSGIYAFNTPFRKAVNMEFNSQTQHICRTKNEKVAIPLPPNTILEYRTSETMAKYESKSKKEDIICFYEKLVTPTGFSIIKKNDNLWEILLVYNDHELILTLNDKKENNHFSKSELIIDVAP